MVYRTVLISALLVCCLAASSVLGQTAPIRSPQSRNGSPAASPGRVPTGGAPTAGVPTAGAPVAGPANASGPRPGTPAAMPAAGVPNAPRQGPPQALGPNFVPQSPDWIPLPPDHEEYLNKVLQYWEFRSNQITRYQCDFNRWEYDPVFGPKDPTVCKSFSKGIIRFEGPDKGLFKVDSTKSYVAPKSAGEKPKYEDRPNGEMEHWVCDGTSIFHFDYQKKQLIKTVLPPSLQGKAIVDGPLPFLFGAKADQIKERYWIRVITPRDRKGEYWLEAVPKTQQDAANYKMVHVMLEEKEFLPIGLVIFPLNHTPELPARTTLRFENRKVNANSLASLNPLSHPFYEVDTPKGWELLEQTYDTAPPSPNAPPAAGEPRGSQVRRPQPIMKK